MPAASPRLPPWLKVRAPGGPRYTRMRETLAGLGLHTVCEEARCPNLGECWGEGTATMMVLGDVCTRACRFCAVESGRPAGKVDANEPENVAVAVEALGLDYVVLTMVDRDDLPDGGADHVAQCVVAIRRKCPGVLVEMLSGDFAGDESAIATVAASGADVLAHNLETVRSLQERARDPRCGYELSLSVLRRYRVLAGPGRFVKSSLMLGLGERLEEVLETMDDLRGAGVELLTLGQYLRPTVKHLPVTEFVPPETFDALRAEGLARGFLHVSSGPLVRSSYRAAEAYVRSSRAASSPS